MARLTLLMSLAALFSGCGGVWLPETIERRVGEMVSRELARELPAKEDDRWAPFIQDAGRKIAAVSERPAYSYVFKIVRTSEVNALALPNGEILVTEGLLRLAGRDGEVVAAVLGHEIGHVARRHSAEALQSQVGAEVALTLLFGFERSLGRAAAEFGAQLEELGYGREMELEADLCAIRYLTRLGYPAETGLKFLKVLASLEEGEKHSAFERYLRTHPPAAERIRYAQTYADSLSASKP